ncbi:MAG: hypothetical protein AMR96_00605 [Candidatus Adiutrix intracellularis]|jgi:hypothetical protein|nr:MAG: hypothetical protein AMR96_00605 [Candidatus Adiutrix intracellularis]MDR2827664.1 hypothetical protein [Candidatus Adiutrix intracellularis]
MQLLKSHVALGDFSFLQKTTYLKKRLIKKIKLNLGNVNENPKKQKAIKARRLEFEAKIQYNYKESKLIGT